MLKSRRLVLPAVVTALAFAVSPVWAADSHPKVPPKFKEVSTLVKLPSFLPGLGSLYVDPATLPVGPYLGYNRAGKMVNVIYMVPLADLTAQKNFNDLGTVVKGVKINHTDIDYNPGHPGVEQPHYHVVEWLIPHAAEAELK